MLVGLDLQFQFRSTLPHGERLASSQNSTPLLLFRSTLPHGERRDVPSGVRICSEFRSTLPHGERPAARAESPLGYLFRSTLPHGERRFLALARYPRLRVSIHAPARGATSVCLVGRLCGVVSIHAPARGATPRPAAGRGSRRSFDPRSRTGSDHRHGLLAAHALVSIHAPARGATPR